MRATVLALCLTVFVGCAQVPTQHVLMFDSDGAPVDPADPELFGGYGRLLEPGDEGYDAELERRYDLYVKRLTDALRLHVQTTGQRRVVVFVHGGLNTSGDALDRVIETHQDILASGAFPIFVNWRSSLLGSYLDHLFWVRQGGHVFGAGNDLLDDTFDVLGVLWSPFQFAGDAARGVIRMPLTATYQLEETTEWLGWARAPERESADAALGLTEPGVDTGAPLAIPFVDGMDHDGEGVATWLEELFGFARWVVFSPVKLVSTIAVDAGGLGSWEVMRRRVALLFHREDEFLGMTADRDARGLLWAIAQLAKVQDDLDLEISLVGHSMGGMVVNGLLEHANLYHHLEGGSGLFGRGPAPETVRLPEFSDIVYLGAANSVAAYEQAAFGYLLHDRGARVFHVVLHPENEVGEAPYWDLAPRGSLLTWIDDFLARPRTPRERTAGRYSNLLPALRDTPEELRDRVHVRVLPWNDDALPQEHGELDDELEAWRFWDAASWFPREQARNVS